MAARNVETGLWEYEGQIVDHDVDIDSPPGNTGFGLDYFVIGENIKPHSFTTVADFRKIHLMQQFRDFPIDDHFNRNLYPIIEKQIYDQVKIDAPPFLRDLYQQYRLIKPLWERTIKAFEDCTKKFSNNDDVIIEKGKHKGRGGFIYAAKNKLSLEQQPWIQVIDATTGETYMVKPHYCRLLLPLKKLSGEAACMDCRTICNFDGLRWIIPFNRPICYKCYDYYQEINVLPMGEDLINIQGPFEYDKSADNFKFSNVR